MSWKKLSKIVRTILLLRALSARLFFQSIFDTEILFYFLFVDCRRRLSHVHYTVGVQCIRSVTAPAASLQNFPDQTEKSQTNKKRYEKLNILNGALSNVEKRDCAHLKRSAVLQFHFS